MGSLLLGHRRGREKDGVASPQPCLLLPTVHFLGLSWDLTEPQQLRVLPSHAQPAGRPSWSSSSSTGRQGQGVAPVWWAHLLGREQSKGRLKQHEFTSVAGVIPLNAFIEGRRKPALSWPAGGHLSALLPSMTLPPWGHRASAARDTIKAKQLISRRSPSIPTPQRPSPGPPEPRLHPNTGTSFLWS